MTAVLRPHQVRLLDALDRAIAEGERRIVVQAPTGFGKTIVAANRMRRLQDSGRRGIFIVPTLSLIDQTIEKFWAEGITDVGVIQADHSMTNYGRPIQIASVQTLQRRLIPEADEIILDEAHRWFRYYPKILEAPGFVDVPIIGITATPWTKSLGKHFDRLIIGATTQELIETGYLARFRVFAPASPDLTKVHTVAGDYHEGELADVMNQATLVADVVDTWLDRAKDRPTLCFAVDRAHAKHLQTKFEAAGIATGYIDYLTDANERTEIGRRLRTGELKVVVNVTCLTIGIDWPEIGCLILARPTKSEMLFVQMVGRGLRVADGKSDCLILDHSDNHLRLGFVTDIHHSHLDLGREPRKIERKDRESLPKKCPSCSFLRPAKVHVCPACGFAPEPRSNIHHRDGELVEFTARNRMKVASLAERQTFFRELRHYGAQHGYKPGWVAHKYREKFGVWPRGLDDLDPMPPSRTTLGWILSRQIAYAKAVGRAG